MRAGLMTVLAGDGDMQGFPFGSKQGGDAPNPHQSEAENKLRSLD